MYIEKVGWLFCDRFYFLLDFALEEDDEDEVVEKELIDSPFAAIKELLKDKNLR